MFPLPTPPRLLLSVLVLLCSVLVTAQEEMPVSSTIEEATVFLEGAQVTRTATATVPAGRRAIIFTGLTADLDPESVKVSTRESGFLVLSVSHRMNFGTPPEPGPEVRELEARVETLDFERDLISTRANIAREEEEILRANRSISGQASGLAAEDLERAVRFHRERLTEIRMNYLRWNRQLDSLAKVRESLMKQLAEMRGKKPQKAQSEIVVITEAERSATADFRLSYLVPEAGWEPYYDVRVTDISQPVNLRYRAKVSQDSGEDWEDIKLTLSTGDPKGSAVAPSLEVWRLYGGSRPPTYRPLAARDIRSGYRSVSGRIFDANGEPLIGATVLVQGTTIGTVADVDGNFRIDVPMEATALTFSYTGYRSSSRPITGGRLDVLLEDAAEFLDEVVVTGRARSRKQRRDERISEEDLSLDYSPPPPPPPPPAPAPVPTTVYRQATTVSFQIDLPYSIPSDGKERDVEINQHQLPAHYTHVTVPKVNEAAYLTAAVTNWEQYDLLSGEIQLFFEGTYLGRSYLDVSATEDTLNLSLGKDPNVVVERTEITEFRKESFLGGKVSQSRGYRIEVRNRKEQPIRLLVKEQIPVSADNEITVKSEISSGGRLESESGMVRWELQLPPQREVKVSLEYTVRAPRHKRIYLD
ncbi:DUF4139 domain-containing protein [Lewinella sp. W8]|uniref:DUF4139 domain-containing protein n=1 Tax=Lewinella sp. W8 TaxID=2528208 RepID=UPI001067AA7D|nr:DUF4139 domain-containing protein [Lewinella sp. W8]MTB49900.1 mucoidy inhibitor MuiA family protein [Lewinella sp. W8]